MFVMQYSEMQPWFSQLMMMMMMMMMSVFVVWLSGERSLTLFPARKTVRDPHHREFSARREQDLNLPGTLVQASLNEFLQY